MRKNKKSSQDWLPFRKVLENGIIVTEKSFIKIIKIYPINYDLKSNLEKEAILNSYKNFLKNCDFNFQILVQSIKENLSYHISQIKENNKSETNPNIVEFKEEYINFIHSLENDNKSSTKEFFIILKYKFENSQKDYHGNKEGFATNQLNEQYFKIKDSLSRCGNIVKDINTREEGEKFIIKWFSHI